MLEGTKKLFPTEYEKFKTAMVEAADGGQLPVSLALRDITGFTLKDFEDAFTDINMETGLETTCSLELDPVTGRLAVTMTVDQPAIQPKTPLQ